MVINIINKTSTYKVSLPHSETASCPLSAFPTFRIPFAVCSTHVITPHGVA